MSMMVSGNTSSTVETNCLIDKSTSIVHSNTAEICKTYTPIVGMNYSLPGYNVYGKSSTFNGCIVSLNVEQCRSVNAIVKYKPSQRSKYHSEIHGSENTPLLSKSQRKKLAEVAKMEYYEN